MKLLKKNQLQSAIQVCCALLLFHLVYFKQQQGFTTALGTIPFLLFLISVTLIALGGLVLYQLTKQEEKPHLNWTIKLSNGYYIYFALTVIGVGIGYYLCNFIAGRPTFLAYFILQAVLLYSFISQWRKSFIWSNLLNSFLLVFPLYGMALLDLIPKINEYNFVLLRLNFGFIVDFSVLLFFLFLLQSLIQDILFRPSDYIDQKRTLAVRYGSKIAAKSGAGLALFIATSLLVYTLVYLTAHSSLFIYILALIIAPLLYCAFELWQAKTRKNIKTIHLVLQMTIWTTILSIALLTYNLTTYVAS